MSFLPGIAVQINRKLPSLDEIDPNQSGARHVVARGRCRPQDGEHCM
jgi:hypothetical protein